MFVSLQRTYSATSLKELKRQAREDNEIASALLSVVHYGYSLRAVLWFLIGLSAAGFFVAISLSAPLWFALSASGVLVWLGFVWIPAARVSYVSELIAAKVAPILSRILLFLHPIIDFVVRLIHRHRPVTIHTGVYDRYDLIDLLNRQKVQPDNRIEETELAIALNALQFGDDTISEHMTPRRIVKSISYDEITGPIFMDELHASGFSRFPVYKDNKDSIVGILFLRDLITAKEGGAVEKYMKNNIAYIHEDQSLHDALQAVLKTHKHMFVVVNSFEEYVGIITIEDILEKIVGAQIIDEFDQYEDIRAVARKAATKEHKMHDKIIENQESTTEDSTEVVE